MLDINIHRNLLIQILKEIYSNTQLAPILGLKGGTAIYLFHHLPRFSVDLDFDLLDEEKKHLVFETIGNILKDFGKMKEKIEKRFTLFFLLSYSEKTQNIKIEISKRKFLSQYEIKNYLGIPIFTMKKEDIFANKLITFLERKKLAHRDIFDLWFFFKNHWDLNKKLVEKRTGIPFQRYLKHCQEYLQKVDNRRILSGMGELLDEQTKRWVKINLKKDLIFLLSLYRKRL